MLRDNYIKEAYIKARKVGDFVNIGDVVQTLLIDYNTSEKEIKKVLLKLFYIENKIDLVPGKSDYKIEDRNGNKFAYMIWRNERSNNKGLKETVDNYSAKLKELINNLKNYDYNDSELKKIWEILRPSIDTLEDTKKLIRKKLGIL